MSKEKKYNYFRAFVELSKYSLDSAENLLKILKDFSVSNISANVEAMHNIEHSADLAKHDLLNHLVKEFLPPIEREDITSISQDIDNVTDAIEDVVIRLDMYNVQSIRPEVIEFAEKIVKCCHAMNAALDEFSNFKKSKTLHDFVIEINRLEEECDVLYANAVRELYKSSKDPVELLVWTRIFDRLEQCADACEDVADNIETVVMKNS